MKERIQIKNILAALLVFALIGLVSNTALAAGHPDRVADMAGLLTEEESSKLETKLDSISEQYGIDMAIVTVNDTEWDNAADAADVFFETNGYGLGEDRSGVMLFICIDKRDWQVTTNGEGKKIVSQSDIASLGDAFGSDLSSGNYYNAFTTYADMIGKDIQNAKTYHWLRYLIISLAIGFVVAFIRVAGLKSSLKSVATVESAADYVVKDSLHLTNSKDLFLYKTRKATKKENTQASTVTRSGAADSSHGGGGGKF